MESFLVDKETGRDIQTQTCDVVSKNSLLRSPVDMLMTQASKYKAVSMMPSSAKMTGQFKLFSFSRTPVLGIDMK